jgi:hypothetical protein
MRSKEAENVCKIVVLLSFPLLSLKFRKNTWLM